APKSVPLFHHAGFRFDTTGRNAAEAFGLPGDVGGGPFRSSRDASHVPGCFEYADRGSVAAGGHETDEREPRGYEDHRYLRPTRNAGHCPVRPWEASDRFLAAGRLQEPEDARSAANEG